MNQLPVMEIIMPQQPTGNVPAFLAKLWKMVENQDTGKTDTCIVNPSLALAGYCSSPIIPRKTLLTLSV